MSHTIDLKARRKELGLSQLSIARLVGVSESTISRWESGNIANMKRSYIVNYAKALRLSPADIVGTDDIVFDTTTKTPAPSLPISLTFKLSRLDATDQAKVEAYTDGLLDQDKYKPASSAG